MNPNIFRSKNSNIPSASDYSGYRGSLPVTFPFLPRAKFKGLLNTAKKFLLSKVRSRHLIFHLKNIPSTWDWRDGIAGKVSTLHDRDSSLILGIPYGPLSSKLSDP